MPGKQTLTETLAPVQMRVSGDPPGDAAVHTAAAQGAATPVAPLPYASQIQQAFGRHDISSVRAHTGPEAAASARAMGADAYATGDHVVLGRTDLHTVAHEAAHVIQQRDGVSLKGGVGAAGDRHERDADAVADLVVEGRSAEPLLDQMAGSGGGAASAVQRKINGFSHAEVKVAPQEVVAKVLETKEFPDGLSPEQFGQLRDLINLPDELSIEEVRRRLHEFDEAADNDEKGKATTNQKPKKKKSEESEKEKEREEDEESEAGLSRFHAFLPNALPAMLQAMLEDPHELTSFAMGFGLTNLDEIKRMIKDALTAALRPTDELLDAIAVMSPAMLKQIAQHTTEGRAILSEYNVERDRAAIADAIKAQQAFYSRFEHLIPETAVHSLADRDSLRSIVASCHDQPDRVMPHVVAILQRVIERDLSRATKASELPKAATAMLSLSQDLGDQQLLAPGHITSTARACSFGRLQMYCSIGGRPPEVSGRDLDRFTQGKPLQQFLTELLEEEASDASLLAPDTPVKVAQRMSVLNQNDFVRVICKHGLLWVPSACVQIDPFEYKVPQTQFDEDVRLYGSGNRPEVGHVKQGQLGNCYLMAALISVVDRDQRFITDMLCELGDQTVAVRFFVRDRATDKLVPEWIHVDRNLVLRDGQAIYAGAKDALWPAIIEKAYGVLAARASGGGLETVGQGGQSSSVFVQLLGQPALEVDLANPGKSKSAKESALHGIPPNPLAMLPAQLTMYFELDNVRARAFAEGAESARKRLEHEPGAIEDCRSVLEAVAAIANEAHITGEPLASLQDYVRQHIPAQGTSGGAYSVRAMMLHGTIALHLKNGCVVALGSKSWSASRRGPSGEPLSNMGLAGGHAYAVLGAHDHGGHLMLRIRNPWGHMGMKYERRNSVVTTLGNLLNIPVLARVEISAPEFDIDIEDVIRFFNQLYIGETEG